MVTPIRSTGRALWTAVALGTGASLAWGCPSNACLDLCTTWYSYRDTVCDDPTAADALARCEGDYRSLDSDGAEAAACGEALDLAVLDSDDPRCCDLGEDCPELPLSR